MRAAFRKCWFRSAWWRAPPAGGVRTPAATEASRSPADRPRSILSTPVRDTAGTAPERAKPEIRLTPGMAPTAARALSTDIADIGTAAAKNSRGSKRPRETDRLADCPRHRGNQGSPPPRSTVRNGGNTRPRAERKRFAIDDQEIEERQRSCSVELMPTRRRDQQRQQG